MANKFQKSVMARISKDENEPEKKLSPSPSAAAKKEKAPQPQQPPVATATAPPAVADNRKAEPGPHPAKSPSIDIGSLLRPTPQREAKNKTFYLDSDVIDAIKETAKQQGITDSRLVNDVLRRLFGMD